mgnify:CR=1 FL=1
MFQFVAEMKKEEAMRFVLTAGITGKKIVVIGGGNAAGDRFDLTPTAVDGTEYRRATRLR